MQLSDHELQSMDADPMAFDVTVHRPSRSRWTIANISIASCMCCIDLVVFLLTLIAPGLWTIAFASILVINVLAIIGGVTRTQASGKLLWIAALGRTLYTVCSIVACVACIVAAVVLVAVVDYKAPSEASLASVHGIWKLLNIIYLLIGWVGVLIAAILLVPYSLLSIMATFIGIKSAVVESRLAARYANYSSNFNINDGAGLFDADDDGANDIFTAPEEVQVKQQPVPAVFSYL
jgi:hypothetical protein